MDQPDSYQQLQSFDGNKKASEICFGKTENGQCVSNTIAETKGNLNSLAGNINYIITFMNIVLIMAIIFKLLYGALLHATSDIISNKTKGKEMMQNAGYILIIYIFTYAILFWINPDLTKFNLPEFKIQEDGEKTTIPSVLTADKKNPISGIGGCKTYDKQFSETAKRYNIDKNLLMAIGTQESSGCTKNLTSPKGAKGIMQIMPETAKLVNCSGDYVGYADPAIDCAAKIISQNKKQLQNINAKGGYSYTQSGKNRVVKDKKNKKEYFYDDGNGALIAAYNAGAGTKPGTSASQKKPAFATSSDCDDAYAWECPENPGGFVETQGYVKNVQKYQKEKPWNK